MTLSMPASGAIREMSRRDRANSHCDVGYTVLTVAAIVDDFLDNSLRRAIEDQRPFGHPLAGEVYKNMYRTDGVPQTWQDRVKWVDRLGRLQISGTRPVQKFLRLTKVRNGLAHSSGCLTRRDRRSRDLFVLERQLASDLEIGFNGKYFVFGPNTRRLALEVGIKFVEKVDSSIGI